MKQKNAWLSYTEEQLLSLENLSTRYMDFLSNCKTERECVSEFVKIAERKGFRKLGDIIKGKIVVKPGDKIYINNKGKSLALFVIGEEEIENGMNIVGAHVDAPRVDLKQIPLYEDGGLALFDTHYYGGIKKYQWVTIPMALHGIVIKKSGEKIDINIGEKPGDPVFCFTDILIHLAKNQMDKKASDTIDGEDLNLLVGSKPMLKDEKPDVKEMILSLIKEKYDFEEDDFMSAEIEIVPAGRARECGLDKSMIMGYGHDDRVCSYGSFEAILEISNPKKTVVSLIVDKEEIGSVGSTSMGSKFFENAVAEIINSMSENYSELKLKRTLQNSKMLSADVSAAFDPNFASAYEKKNTAFFGNGISISKYTGSRGKSGSNDANPEFLAEIRNIFDENNVAFQTAELGKVDQGGGGTIAYILAAHNMEVVDAGVPVLNMHSTGEVISKADLYETTKGFKAFYLNA